MSYGGRFMRFRMSAAVAIGVAAAGVMVAGCSSASSGSALGGPATTAAATPTATASPATASSRPPQAAGNGNGSTCAAANLSYALGARTGDASQAIQAVNLTNKGSSACTLAGFPGVNLVGAADGKQDFTWSLVRQSARYSMVTLRPGQAAHFSLVYLPAAAGDGTNISVAKMVITPPDDYAHAELAWKQPVLLQDGATHPGTFVTPVAAGA
jgi:hypothetical protein